MEYCIPYIIIVSALVCASTYYFTKRKVSEKILIEHSEMKQALAHKDKELNYLVHEQNKFWSVITHELKNVFYSFYNSIDLLNTEYEILSEDERKTLVQNIGNSYNYTLSVINDLMEWSKVNRQVQKLSFETFNLRVLVDELLLNMNDNFSFKEIEVIKEMPDDVYVYADRMMIAFIIKNIFQNSIKFSNRKGIVNISSSEDKNSVKIIVRDNGVGISKENLERLFNLEEIFSTHGTEKEKGTGLGLLICKEFTELNNGQIFLESEEGQYTSVRISLPLGNNK